MFSISKNIRVVLPYLWKNKTLKHKCTITSAVLLFFLTIGFNLSIPIIFKEIVNTLANKNYKYALVLSISYVICWTLGRFLEKI